MRSSLTETISSESGGNGGATGGHYLWALDETLAAQLIQEMQPAPGTLRSMPPREQWEEAFARSEVGVAIAASSGEALPEDDIKVLQEMGVPLILLLPECSDALWRRFLARGFVDVLAPPFRGLDLSLTLVRADHPLPLDRRLPDFDARVRTRTEFAIPADLRYVAPAAGYLARIAREHGFHPRVWLENLPLALDEAISNSIRHGCGQDSALEVKVEVWFSHDVMKIRIEDPGNGFDPDALIDPASEEGLHRGGGRGVLLMRELMDRVEFQDGGRVVLLHARRSASE